MSKYKNQQAIREKLDKELGSYKIDGKEFREMWGLFDLVVVFLDEQLNKKEEEVLQKVSRKLYSAHAKVWGSDEFEDSSEYTMGMMAERKAVMDALEIIKTQTKK